jgi:general secretion pathway protein D
MDNNKATLSVGQSIPFQTQGVGSVVAGQTSILTNYARSDVALKLEITPHLNDSDAVRLEIDGNIEDVPDGQSTAQPGGPTTNKRTLKTAVVVKDGDTIVLGGLQKDSQSESVEKIPGLGDIPVLGRLFQYRSKQHTKQDLLIILTPYVIRGPEDLRRIYEQREAERREFIERCTTFSDAGAYEAHVDYRRKRGLLQEINLAALEAERDARALRHAEGTLHRAAIEGPVGD